MNPGDGGDWVKLESYPTLIAAEAAKSTLALNGIESTIFDGEMAGLYSNALGGAKLMVKSEDCDAARELLKAEMFTEDAVVSEADEISDSSVYCIRCHSKNVEVENVKKWFWTKKVIRCRACGGLSPG